MPPVSARVAVINWTNAFGVFSSIDQQDSILVTATDYTTAAMFGTLVCPLLQFPTVLSPPSTASNRISKHRPSLENYIGPSLDVIPAHVAQYIDFWAILKPIPQSQPNGYNNYSLTPGISLSQLTCGSGAVATPEFYRKLYSIGNRSVTNPLTNLSTQLSTGYNSYAAEDMQTFASLYNIKLGNISSKP